MPLLYLFPASLVAVGAPSLPLFSPPLLGWPHSVMLLGMSESEAQHRKREAKRASQQRRRARNRKQKLLQAKMEKYPALANKVIARSLVGRLYPYTEVLGQRQSNRALVFQPFVRAYALITLASWLPEGHSWQLVGELAEPQRAFDWRIGNFAGTLPQREGCGATGRQGVWRQVFPERAGLPGARPHFCSIGVPGRGSGPGLSLRAPVRPGTIASGLG